MSQSEIPNIVEVAGRSMEPTVPIGARVVVRPIETGPAPLDVVLIEGHQGWIVHRVVLIDRASGRVYHRGDGEGGVGLCQLDAVAGAVSAVLGSDGSELLVPQDMPSGFMRRLDRLAVRCRIHAWMARLAERMGIKNSALGRFGSRQLRRIVLGG